MAGAWKKGCWVRHKNNPDSVWTVTDFGKKENSLFSTNERSQGMDKSEFIVMTRKEVIAYKNKETMYEISEINRKIKRLQEDKKRLRGSII